MSSDWVAAIVACVGGFISCAIAVDMWRKERWLRRELKRLREKP